MKPLVYILAGAALATTLVLACSDDPPGDADAAVCDCPAAEAPVPARIATARGIDFTLSAGGGGGAVAPCPTGAKLLSGGCFVDNGGVPAAVELYEFGKETDQEIWNCRWRSQDAQPITVYAQATCLVP